MFEYQPTLKGHMIYLRPVKTEDVKGLLKVGLDSDVWAGLPHLELHLESKFRKYFQEGLESGGALVATTCDTGKIIGWSRYSSQFAEHDEIEIGWTFLGRAYWGGRYNGEMKRLMLAHAFRFVERVIFRVRESNLRSRRSLEKIGARQLPDRSAGRGPDRGPAILFYGISRGDLSVDDC